MEKEELVVRVNPGQKVQPKIVPIRGGVDAFDRYKMRQLCVHVLGKGKMIRTVLTNVDEVAHDLKTEPSYIGAYCAYVLGAQSKYDTKKQERERASISGEHSATQLSSLLRDFIREVVLCPSCHLPETTLSLDKKDDVNVRCSGCGYNAPLRVENSKFAKFVSTHPPSVVNTKNIRQTTDEKAASSSSTSSSTSSGAAGGSQSSVNAHDSSSSNAGGGGGGSNGASEGSTTAATSPSSKSVDSVNAASAKGSPQQRGAAAKGSAGTKLGRSGDHDEEPEVWSVSTDAAAVKRRLADMLPAHAVAVLVDDKAATPDAAGALAALRAFLAQQTRAPEQVVAEYKRLQTVHHLLGDKALRAEVLFDALFSGQNITLKDTIRLSKPILEPFLGDEAAQRAVVRRLEKLCAERGDLVKKVAVVAKEFYEQDLLGEDPIVAYYKSAAPTDDATAKAVKKALAPMVEWLQRPDDDDDDEEEDDEEEEEEEEEESEKKKSGKK